MKKTKSHSVIESLSVNNKRICNAGEIAEAFNQYFASIGTKLGEKLGGGDGYVDYLTQPQSANFFITPTNEHEVYNEVSKLPNKTSAGIDGISQKLLKQSIDIILEPFTHILNCSFVTATVPDTLKIAKLTPIYKRGKKDDRHNYRPISLLSSFNKVLEKLMYKMLYTIFSSSSSSSYLLSSDTNTRGKPISGWYNNIL